MKKLKCALAAILMCLTACLCGACSTKEEQPDAAITQNTQTFINIVAKLPDQVTVDDGYKIEAALLVYDYLNDAEKNNSDVAASKTRLDGLKTQYDAVKAVADEEAEIAREERLVLNFVSDVDELYSSLNRLKLDDKATVEALIEKYGQLKDESKQQSNVKAAYAKLGECAKKIEKLEEDARKEIVEAAATKFIDAIEDVLEAIEEADDRNEAILAAGDTLKDLRADYKDFEDDVKDYDGVAEAKLALDELYAEYEVLFDAKAVEEFLDCVAALPPVEQVTLEHERAIGKAESAYEKISAASKTDAKVAQAYAVLHQAREKYDALFAVAEAERVQIFIAAANKVPTNIEDVDISWYDVLDAAGKAYWALNPDTSHNLPEVVEAFNRWNAAQTAFDKQGYQQITMKNPNVIFSGHAVNPMIVLQNEYEMINKLLEFYNVTDLSEIADKVTVWLNVYVDGEYVGRGALSVTLLAHEIGANHVQEVLRQLSTQNGNVVNGGSFSFSLNFEDKDNEFIPSAHTNVSESKVYNW